MGIATKKKRCDRQLRLLLPAEWIADLDSIADSKFISRLALIREYLRECANRDLQSLEAQFKQMEGFRAVRGKIAERTESIRKSCADEEW